MRRMGLVARRRVYFKVFWVVLLHSQLLQEEVVKLEPPAPGRVYFLDGFQMKSLEEEDPFWKKTQFLGFPLEFSCGSQMKSPEEPQPFRKTKHFFIVLFFGVKGFCSFGLFIWEPPNFFVFFSKGLGFLRGISFGNNNKGKSPRGGEGWFFHQSSDQIVTSVFKKNIKHESFFFYRRPLQRRPEERKTVKFPCWARSTTLCLSPEDSEVPTTRRIWARSITLCWYPRCI